MSAGIATSFFSLCAVAQPAQAAAATDFRPTPLPPNVGYLNSISCPSQQSCFVAGQTSGSDQRGLVLRLVNGSWQQTVVASTSYLTGISCADATHCAAVGITSDPAAAGAGVVINTTDGSTWRLPAQPSSVRSGGLPPIPLYSVSCTGSFCMAAGGVRSDGSGAPASEIWTTTGGAWAAVTVPFETGTHENYLVSVNCTDRISCWVVGFGAWHSTDGGATWQQRSPPQTTAPVQSLKGLNLISTTWSLLTAVEFTDPSHGTVAGGDQCGGDVDHCGGAIFRTADGGLTWNLTSDDATPFIEALSCSSTATPCIATSATFTPIRPGGATANVNDGAVVVVSTGGRWHTTQRQIPDNLTSVACPASTQCLAVGGDQPHNVGAIFTEDLLTRPAALSVTATSIPAPADAFGGVGRAIVNTAITLAALVALTFPAQLFNRTFEENYDEILAITRRRFGALVRVRAHQPAPESRPRNSVVFASVVVAGSILGSLRDPQFGANTSSVLLFLATALTLLITVAMGYLSTRVYRARVHASVAAHLHALPAGLAVAALCVAVSRIASFQPGYLYGVVCGAVFAGSLKRRQLGQVTIVSSLSMLALATAAWFAWVPINHVATHHGAFVGVILLDDLLASIFVGGITGTVISLLPLRFMPGQALFSWHRGAWAAAFGIATFGLLEILVRPASDADHPGNVAWLTAAILFAIFGIGSLAFREYFARHVPADLRRYGLGAEVITRLRHDDGRSEAALADVMNVPPLCLHATVDRLERAGWIERKDAPQHADVEVPLHLSRHARDLQTSGRVGWLTRKRLTLALTSADRAVLGSVQPNRVRAQLRDGRVVRGKEQNPAAVGDVEQLAHDEGPGD